MRRQSLKFGYLQTNNPQQFWKEINKLGPRRQQKIPMEVVLSNDTIESRKEFVLKKWEQDLADLFSGNHIPSIFDDIIFKEACDLKVGVGEKYEPRRLFIKCILELSYYFGGS